jgi:hypothetical protein
MPAELYEPHTHHSCDYTQHVTERDMVLEEDCPVQIVLFPFTIKNKVNLIYPLTQGLLIMRKLLVV